MIRALPICNTYSIVLAPAARRIVRAAVILLAVFCLGEYDACRGAPTGEQEQNSDQTQAKIVAEVPAEEPTVTPSGPQIITETIVTDVDSWGNTASFGEKIDWLHAGLYKTAQGLVGAFDNMFRSRQKEKRAVELSRFRIGVFGEGKIRKHEQTDLDSIVDFDTDIELPLMKRRLKLIITTLDPTKLPSGDITDQQDTAVRAAVGRQWWPNVSTHAGVRIRWQPELFANAVWSTTWKRDVWKLYPEQRFYWEQEQGFGEISTLAFDHWKNRWNTRFSTSIKWSEEDWDADRDSERPDEGFRWSDVFIFGYATELLDETQLGRIISGGDVARGWGIRLAAFGGFHFVEEYRAGIFYRFPLRKKWMYFMIGPDINWANVNDWDREWSIKFGIEMLFWGGKER